MTSSRRSVGFLLALLLTAGTLTAQGTPDRDFAGSWTGPLAGGLYLGTFELTQEGAAVKGAFRATQLARPMRVEGTVRPDGVLEACFDGETSKAFEVHRVEGPALETNLGASDDPMITFRPAAAPKPAEALAGAFDGPTTTFRHEPTGLTFELPQGWTASWARADLLTLAAADEASLRGPRMIALRIEEGEGARDLTQLVGVFGAELLRPLGQDMASGHMTIEPRAVTVQGAAGAEVGWSLTLKGDVVVKAWAGAVRASSARTVIVAAFVEGGREQEDLPRAKRVLASVKLEKK